MEKIFKNRVEAGRQLGARLKSWAGRDPVVVGLTRGGVPVAAEVAEILGAELDVLVVGRLASPVDSEVAIGAVAEGGAVWLEPDIELIADRSWIRSEIVRQESELRRRQALLRSAIAPLSLSSRAVILVDDGVATGATVSAAVRAARILRASSVIVSAPVASREAARDLASRADAAVFLIVPELFVSVGQWYEDFSPVPDEAVLSLLREARRTNLARACAGGRPERPE